MDNRELMVTIRCLAYNQEPYIRQCLDGFVMQKTDFRFEAIVHDDASTDGTAAIIREYAEQYPDIIKPIFETENQYSKRDGSIRRIMNEHTRGKYVAICEGDDYWIDPLKLQKQVDFLEGNPEYTMCFNRTIYYSEKTKKYIKENVAYSKSQTAHLKDIIQKGGTFISTCSIVYRHSLQNESYPNYCKKCLIGDYPLQIYCAIKGRVYYFNEAMSVYRTDNYTSWCGTSNKTTNIYKIIELRKSIVEMLIGFSTENPQYKEIFNSTISFTLNIAIPKFSPSVYLDKTSIYLPHMSVLWKIDRWCRSHIHHKLSSTYSKIVHILFLNSYYTKFKGYD